MLKLKEDTDIKELEKYGYKASNFQGFDVYLRHNPLVGSTELIPIENRDNPVLLILTERGYHPGQDTEHICRDEDIIRDFFKDVLEAGLLKED